MERRRIFNRPLTFAGLCWLVLILSAAAGLSLLGHRLISQRAYKLKVRAQLPQLCHRAAAQRDRLISAIDHYKELYGYYPPDHVLSTNPVVVDSITNQLFYELIGCAYNPTGQVYLPSGTSVLLPRGLIHQFFGRDISNSAQLPAQPKSFLPSAGTETLAEIHRKPETLALLWYAPDWEGFDGDSSGLEIGTWRYNCSAPQHNRGSYDLWLEVRTAETNLVISNW